jgi:Putative papain-like cysteine peptidase (DUF1796)
MSIIGISLGYNCSAASHGVDIGIRSRKSCGYNTCPFDEMNSNYEGLVRCLQDDFRYFTDVRYLRLIKHLDTCNYYPGETLIYNTKYGFIFNHESPGHADLYKIQAWPGGINHFIENDFQKFRERYDRRIENFRNYIRSNSKIVFIIYTPDSPLTELRNVLSTICKDYTILRFDIKNTDSYKEHMNFMIDNMSE